MKVDECQQQNAEYYDGEDQLQDARVPLVAALDYTVLPVHPVNTWFSLAVIHHLWLDLLVALA